MAQDDYYYEIQLTNKQLVFYFMAGATGLILSFLAGVMVGRGVDAAGGEVQAARPEDRIVAEETAARPTQPPPAQDLTYAQRLEGEKVDDTLEKPKGPKARGAAPSAAQSVAPPAATQKPAPAAKPPAPKPTPAAKPTAKPAGRPPQPPPSAAPAGGDFTIQVGAFKDRASAESIVGRLKEKGYAAYVVAPQGADGGLFNVRVGSYTARADAESVQAKLRDEEKFKPFIVKN